MLTDSFYSNHNLRIHYFIHKYAFQRFFFFFYWQSAFSMLKISQLFLNRIITEYSNVGVPNLSIFFHLRLFRIQKKVPFCVYFFYIPFYYSVPPILNESTLNQRKMGLNRPSKDPWFWNDKYQNWSMLNFTSVKID